MTSYGCYVGEALCRYIMFFCRDSVVLFLLFAEVICQSLDKEAVTNRMISMDEDDFQEWEIITNEENITLQQSIESIGEMILQQVLDSQYDNFTTSMKISQQVGEQEQDNQEMVEEKKLEDVEKEETQNLDLDISQTEIDICEMEKSNVPCLEDLENLGSQILKSYEAESMLVNQNSEVNDDDKHSLAPITFPSFERNDVNVCQNFEEKTNPPDGSKPFDGSLPLEEKGDQDIKPALSSLESNEISSPSVPLATSSTSSNSPSSLIGSLFVTLMGGLVIAFLAWLYQFYLAISNA